MLEFAERLPDVWAVLGPGGAGRPGGSWRSRVRLWFGGASLECRSAALTLDGVRGRRVWLRCGELRVDGYLGDAPGVRGPLDESWLMSPLSSEEIAGLGFERVIASAPVPIVVVDTSGQLIYSNERARDLTAGLGREMPADHQRQSECEDHPHAHNKQPKPHFVWKPAAEGTLRRTVAQ